MISYQLQKIPEKFYIQENVFKTHNNTQFSYWKQAYEICKLNEPHKEQTKYKRIDLYWYRVSKLTNGNINYIQLFNLVKAIPSLNPVNVSARSGLSINKAILDVHGKSLKNNTIEALRLG